jgi:hypothetical protein
MARYSDSVDKIIRPYLACTTKDRVRYKGEVFEPKRLQVSPLIFRSFSCPPMCGACCNTKFTVDFLPTEKAPPGLVERMVEVNGKEYKILSELQKDTPGEHCCYLNFENGWCKVHTTHALTCDFELLRFIVRPSQSSNILLQRLYGRGWNMERVDGERGAKCVQGGWNADVRDDIIRRLYRLRKWADYFEIKTVIYDIVKYVETGPHKTPITLNHKRGGFFDE